MESIFDDRRRRLVRWLKDILVCASWLIASTRLRLQMKQNEDDDDLCFLELFDSSLMIPLASKFFPSSLPKISSFPLLIASEEVKHWWAEEIVGEGEGAVIRIDI